MNFGRPPQTDPRKHEPEIFARARRAVADVHAALEPGRLTIGLWKQGGIGDLMQLAAFARAVKRRFPHSHLTVIFKDLHWPPGAPPPHPLVADVLRGNDAVDFHVTHPQVWWKQAVRQYVTAFDIFFDVQYLAAAYVNPAVLEPAHPASRACLAYYRDVQRRLQIYGPWLQQFPRSNQALAEEFRCSQWQLLAASSGLDVSEEDLFIRPTPIDVPAERYVTVHDGAAPNALVKAYPAAEMIRLIRAIQKAGYPVVQLGTRGLDAPQPCVDAALLDLSINQTAHVIQHAAMHLDVEGGLVYIARAVGTRSAVCFGPTPVEIFGFSGNLNLLDITEAGRPKCGCCWWAAPHWSLRCRRGFPACDNMLPAQKAIPRVLDFLQQIDRLKHLEARTRSGRGRAAKRARRATDA